MEEYKIAHSDEKYMSINLRSGLWWLVARYGLRNGHLTQGDCLASSSEKYYQLPLEIVYAAAYECWRDASIYAQHYTRPR